MRFWGVCKPLAIGYAEPSHVTQPETRRLQPRWLQGGILIPHSFTIEDMVALVRAGLATATAYRVMAGGRTIEVGRLRITEEGGGRSKRAHRNSCGLSDAGKRESRST